MYVFFYDFRCTTIYNMNMNFAEALSVPLLLLMSIFITTTGALFRRRNKLETLVENSPGLPTYASLHNQVQPKNIPMNDICKLCSKPQLSRVDICQTTCKKSSIIILSCLMMLVDKTEMSPRPEPPFDLTLPNYDKEERNKLKYESNRESYPRITDKGFELSPYNPQVGKRALFWNDRPENSEKRATWSHLSGRSWHVANVAYSPWELYLMKKTTGTLSHSSMCRRVCRFCSAVANTRYSALCHLECRWQGSNYLFCLVLWQRQFRLPN